MLFSTAVNDGMKLFGISATGLVEALAFIVGLVTKVLWAVMFVLGAILLIEKVVADGSQRAAGSRHR